MRRNHDEIQAEIDRINAEETKDIKETSKAIAAAGKKAATAEEPKTYADYRVSYTVDGKEVVFEQLGPLSLSTLIQLAEATPHTISTRLKAETQSTVQARKSRKQLQREYTTRQATRHKRLRILRNEIEKLSEGV